MPSQKIGRVTDAGALGILLGNLIDLSASEMKILLA